MDLLMGHVYKDLWIYLMTMTGAQISFKTRIEFLFYNYYFQ